MTSLHIDTARTWRGGQSQVLALVTGLEGLGHPATLVAHESGELRRRAAEGLRFTGFAPRSEFDARAAWTLSRVLLQVRPDVVHAHDPMAVSLAAMAWRMAPTAMPPLFVASRRVDFHLKRHAFSRWKYRQIDVFIAASRLIADMLAGDGVPQDRIEVVHDGVNVGAIDQYPVVDVHGTFWLPHGAPVVGNVAALAAHKGQTHLVSAAAKLVPEMPDLRVLIVGEGDLRPALERQIRDAGLERHVVLTGFREDAIGIIKALDVFVLCSVTEGLGSAALEAMACARPVVGTLAGGIPEAVVDGRTGRLVPAGDPDALARAILELLRDPEARTTFGASGRARVIEQFSVERMVQRTLDVYRKRRHAA